MRNNQPVTQKEFELVPGAVLVSRTDAKGRILNGNEAFYISSGFSKEEIVGEPHNIIRHPDMPSEAFRDLWNTLKSGRPWSGLVKNRRKNGDHYWVRANANPGSDGGYRSVRVTAAREEIKAADALYAKIKNDHEIILHEGAVFRKGIRTRLILLLKRISLSHRLYLLAGVVPAFLGAISVLAWDGMAQSHAQFQAIQAEIISPTVSLNDIRKFEEIKYRESEHEFGEFKTELITVALLGSALISLLIVTTFLRIKNGLAVAQTAAKAISEGNLVCAIPSEGYDEIGCLIAQITIMRNNLQELIGDLKTGLEKLSALASDLHTVASESNLVAASQSESSSSIAAAVEQLSVSIDQVENHAGDANQLAKNSLSKASDSTRVIENIAIETKIVASAVQDTASGMRELERISDEIYGIVNVISEVADQTNLLALNAAIEAARAGEQGRGFAVVADEVRKLAEKTKASNKEIHSMITNIQSASRDAAESMGGSVERVNAGVKLSADAVDSMATIRGDQTNVTQLVDSIASGLSEQAEATRHIATRIEKISQGIEDLAIRASKTNSSAEHLTQVINNLGALAGKFQVA